MEESLSEKDLLLLEIMTYSDDSLADAAADGISWGHPDNYNDEIKNLIDNYDFSRFKRDDIISWGWRKIIEEISSNDFRERVSDNYSIGNNSGEIDKKEGKTFVEIINEYNDNHVNPDNEIGETHMTGQEWQNVIEEIRGNENLAHLKMTEYQLKDAEGKVLAYVYENPKDHSAIVTFKGTTGAREWKDDVTAAGIADSPCLEEALDFINSLPYDKITVVGHSKGGNKAQYVALLSDKVVRAISLDGEGMSKQFLEKYAPEIKANAGKIKCYAYSGDYVHELGFEIPGAEYHYVEGHEPNNMVLNHGAYTMFSFDENGNLCFVIADPDKENEYVKRIRSLANYLINQTQDQGDWNKLESLTGTILSMISSGNFDSDEEKYKAIIETLLDDQNRDTASKLAAYLVVYVKDNGIDEERLKKLLTEYIGVEEDQVPVSTIMYLVNQLTDGGPDPLVKYFPGIGMKSKVKELLVNMGFSEEEADKYSDKVLELYDEIEDKYTKLKEAGVNGIQKCDPPKLAEYTAKVRDFSVAALTSILNVIDEIEMVKFDTFSGWNYFTGEPWYERLQAQDVRTQVQINIDSLSNFNGISKICLKKVFDDANASDNRYAIRIGSALMLLNWAISQVRNTSNTLNPKGA